METDNHKIVHVHVIVKGRVQGVGFRAFTQDHALRKGLHGWVRNLSDGTVEVQAEGQKSNLEAFIQVLQQGPPFSRVMDILVDWNTLNRQTEGFTIRHD